MNQTREDILRILMENREKQVSGSEIAERVHVTRSAVWKNIKALREDGYRITAVTNGGYQLAADEDLFTEETVRAQLGASDRFQVKVFDEIDSTNTELRRLARDGAPEGTAVIARKQTAGKGRLGRNFFSPRNGIYMSLLLRPRVAIDDAMLLTTIAAVAVVDAVEEVTGKETGIKWVNDVYIEGKKICGILTEASFSVETGTFEYAVVGIGINITDPEGGFPAEIRDRAASIYGTEVCPPGVMARLAAAVIRNYYRCYDALPDRAFLASYRDHQVLTGEDIYIYSPDGAVRAHCLGVDEEARLLVRMADGSVRALGSGEVSVRPAGTDAVDVPAF